MYILLIFIFAASALLCGCNRESDSLTSHSEGGTDAPGSTKAAPDRFSREGSPSDNSPLSESERLSKLKPSEDARTFYNESRTLGTDLSGEQLLQFFELVEEATEDVTPQIVRGVAHYLLQRAPEEAKAWAISLPEQDLRNHAVSGITSNLLRQDSESGSKWVLSLEEGVARDWAARVVVGFLSENGDLESARIWKEQIVDKAERAVAEHQIHAAEEKAQGIER